MSAEDLRELVAIARDAGLEGPDLTTFLREERARQRETVRLEAEAIEAERVRQHEFRLQELQRRQELELAEVNRQTILAGAQGAPERRGGGGGAPKLPPFDEKSDDMDAYIHRYEGYATSHRWSRDSWASNLSALLRGNALQVFHRLPAEDSSDYDKLKGALLQGFRLTEARFREKFRDSTPEHNESFTQFVTRITGYLDRWIELSGSTRTFEALRDVLIREQGLSICTEELRLFVQERRPKDAQEMNTLAEQYLDAHDTVYSYWSAREKRGSGRHTAKESENAQENRKESPPQPQRGGNPNRGQCWVCGSTSHFARDCRADVRKKSQQHEKRVAHSTALHSQEVDYLTLESGLKLPIEREGGNTYIKTQDGSSVNIVALSVDRPGNNMPVVTGRIVGIPVPVEVLRDSGCSGTVIRRSMCQPEDYTGEIRTCLIVKS